MHSERARWLPWLLALAGCVFDLAACWPGQMSFDSAYAWWQARGGETSTLVPPVFVLAWRACGLLLDGPGLLFAMHLVLFWSGLALLVRALRCGAVGAAAIMLMTSFAPVVLILRGHVWTDVGLLAALCFATGALAHVHAGARRHWLLPVLLALLYAGLLRHNALPAILPLLAWAAWLALRGRDSPKPMPVVLASVAALAAIIGLGRALDTRVDLRVPVWPSLAQFDLAAISIASDTLRLPDFMHGPALDIADLTQAFRPWSNTPMLTGTRGGMRDPFMPPMSPSQLSVLRKAWLDAIAQEPLIWLAHRWHLSRALFGTHASDWPHELVFVDAETGYRDNPPVARNHGALHRALMRGAHAAVATPLLAAWPCLALGLIAAPFAWRRRREPAGRIGVLVLASAWLYALPIPFIAPAAELRYLGWPCLASLLAFALCVFAPASARAARLEPGSPQGLP